MKFFATLFPAASRWTEPLSSVTRWLHGLIGCAVLATAQPMSAAPDAAPVKELTPDTIIRPRTTADGAARPLDSSPSDSSRPFVLVVAVLLAGVGAWVLIQRRATGGAMSVRGARKLQIDETRPLGNRQYLVVANYDGKKFLLGVTPGQIQMLTPLETEPAVEKKP